MGVMRRTDRQQDETFARYLFTECEYALLCTVDPAGDPYCIPISPVLAGDRFYFHSATVGTKLDNIANHPKVTLACVGKTKLLPERFSTDYESAIAYGEAQLVNDPLEKRRALMLISDKYAASNLAAAPAYIESALNQVAVVRIIIREFTAKARISKEKITE